MNKTVAVSFEESIVKVVHASFNKDILHVEKTTTVSLLDFDEYLKSEKASTFIICNSFRDSNHGIINIPWVKPKYIRSIVESEVRRSVDLKDLSFTFTILGEKIINNRKMLEVFYYAVSTEEINELVGRFYENGKAVKAVYAPPFAAAAMTAGQGDTEAGMGVFGIGSERVTFFTKNGSIYFIRSYETVDSYFGDYDIQNINMTISYCFQNIRINPSSVVLMGDIELSPSLSTLPTVPLASLLMGKAMDCDRDILNEFMLPAASCLVKTSYNLLNTEYRTLYMLKRYMHYASIVFVIMVVLFGGAIAYEADSISTKKESIEVARGIMTDVWGISEELTTNEVRLDKHTRLLEFLNRKEPDMTALLVAMSDAADKDLLYTELRATAKSGNFFSILIVGESTSESNAGTRKLLQGLVGRLDSMPGITVQNETVDIERRTFRVDLEYRNEE
ncbi:MAG: hypothetical protein ISR96_01930 [Nitrospira sp.]|nr:hypothetical protein [bacterium]MBL7048276.1 hypothetical protein [Nitrospira sp.]